MLHYTQRTERSSEKNDILALKQPHSSLLTVNIQPPYRNRRQDIHRQNRSKAECVAEKLIQIVKPSLSISLYTFSPCKCLLSKSEKRLA